MHKIKGMSGVGPFLKDLRTNTAASLKEVADSVHISPSHLADVEKGRAHPTLFELFALAAYHGLEGKRLLIRHLSSQTREEQVALAKVLKGEASRQMRCSNMLHDLQQLHHPQSELAFYSPDTALAPYVENMIFFTSSNCEQQAKMLPDGAAKLFISIDDGQCVLKDESAAPRRFVMQQYCVVGARTRPLLLSIEKNKRFLCINFRPGGLYGLTGRSQGEMTNAIVSAEALFGPSLTTLRSCLRAVSETDQKFQLVARYLTEGMQKNSEYQPLIDCMHRHIQGPVGELVKRTGYSQKHLTTLFKKYTGLTPKYFQRIHRFNEVLQTLHRLPVNLDWHHLVADNNYFDQAHFIHEFRQFTGMNPQSYLEAANFCPRFLHLNRSAKSSSCISVVG